MNIKIITVPFDAENEGFRDDVLTKFLINKKVRSLQPQHLCRLCGHILANERFSGKGHKDHTCKKCMQLPKEHRQALEEEDEIVGFMSQSNVSKKNLSRLRTLTHSANNKIAALASLVLEVGLLYPRKRKRVQFLARRRVDLLEQLEAEGLLLDR